MSLDSDVLVSLACDYVTCVALEKNASEKLCGAAMPIFRTDFEMGNAPRPWGMSGFVGWTTGHVDVGALGEKFMCRLSGEVAARSWKEVVEPSDHITRLDLQATVKSLRGPTQVIDQVRRVATRHANRQSQRPVVRWTADVRGGYTLYLGARESNVFGRVYDVWQKHKLDHYRECVRYEVQFNKRLAGLVGWPLYRNESPMPAIASHVRQFFSSRGVDLQLPYDAGLTYCCPRTRSSDDRCLAWLSRSVRPSVMSLIDRGRGEDVLRALGLVQEIPGEV